MAATHSLFSVFILMVHTYIYMNSIQSKNRAKDISTASSFHSAFDHKIEKNYKALEKIVTKQQITSGKRPSASAYCCIDANH